MASKNKRAGRNWEKEVVSIVANLFGLVILKDGNLHEAQIGRAEEVDIKLDNRGVDIWFSPLLPDFIKQNMIQCKKTLCKGKKVKTIDVQPLFDMKISDDEVPVLFTRIKTRPKKNEIVYGDVVTLKLEDYLELLKKRE